MRSTSLNFAFRAGILLPNSLAHVLAKLANLEKICLHVFEVNLILNNPVLLIGPHVYYAVGFQISTSVTIAQSRVCRRIASAELRPEVALARLFEVRHPRQFIVALSSSSPGNYRCKCSRIEERMHFDVPVNINRKSLRSGSSVLASSQPGDLEHPQTQMEVPHGV